MDSNTNATQLGASELTLAFIDERIEVNHASRIASGICGKVV
jgi:hypothetical protein